MDIYSDYFEDFKGIPGRDVAGVVMFDALVKTLRAAEESRHLTERQRRVVLRQIASQATAIADRYSLDHSIDLNAYIDPAQEAA